MNDAQEILAEIREVKAEQRGQRDLLEQHVTHCQTLYATKAELGAAQTRPLVWFASASLVGVVAAYGRSVAQFVASHFTRS